MVPNDVDVILTFTKDPIFCTGICYSTRSKCSVYPALRPRPEVNQLCWFC